MEHAGLGHRHIEPASGPRDGHIHEPTLLLEPVGLGHTVLVGEEPLFQAREKDGLKLQALGRVNGHELHGILALGRLVVAGLERGMAQEGGQWTHGHPALLHRRAPLEVEGCGRVDQFLQVLHPLLALALRLIVAHEPRTLEHHGHHFLQAQALGLEPKRLDELHEAPNRAARLAIEHACSDIEAAALLLGLVGQQLNAAGADAPRGEVHHPKEGRVLVRILHEPQVGQRMLDLGPLEKPQPAKDPVRHAGLEQGLLDHARLRIASIEHSHLAAQKALLNQAANLFYQPLGLEQIACGLHDPNGLTCAGFRPEVLAQPASVIGNERIGRIQNVAVGAVVLLELDEVAHAELGLEALHVGHVSAPKGVDALVVIAHGKDAAPGIREQLEPLVLQGVGVLKLIDQDMLEPGTVMVTNGV